MPRETRRLVIVVVTASLLLIGVGSVAVRPRPALSCPPARRLTALDGKSDVHGWFGLDRLLVSPRSDNIAPSQRPLWLADLRTDTAKSIPQMPFLGRSCSMRPDFEPSYCFGPYPDPQGKWLLYAWCRESSKEKGNGFVNVSWRLVEVETQTVTAIPPSGEFLPCNSPLLFNDIRWFPDSSGWMLSGWNLPWAYVYLRSSPTVPPHLLPVPQADRWTPAQSLEAFGYSNSTGSVLFAPLQQGRAKPRAIAIAEPAEEPSVKRDLAISQDGRWAITRSQGNRHGELSYPNPFMKELPAECWRTSLTDGTIQKIANVPLDAGLFTLSPNGSKFVYWVEDKAYLLELPDAGEAK